MKEERCLVIEINPSFDVFSIPYIASGGSFVIPQLKKIYLNTIVSFLYGAKLSEDEVNIALELGDGIDSLFKEFIKKPNSYNMFLNDAIIDSGYLDTFLYNKDEKSILYPCRGKVLKMETENDRPIDVSKLLTWNSMNLSLYRFIEIMIDDITIGMFEIDELNMDILEYIKNELSKNNFKMWCKDIKL